MRKPCNAWFAVSVIRQEVIKKVSGPFEKGPDTFFTTLFRVSYVLVPMNEVTRILSAIEQGDPRAAEQLLPLVYDELREVGGGEVGARETRPNAGRHRFGA